MHTNDTIVDLSPRRYPFDLNEQTRIDYAREWGRAHGLLPDLPPGPPSPPGHFCPAREGWFWSGSREACPFCKIAAPGEAPCES